MVGHSQTSLTVNPTCVPWQQCFPMTRNHHLDETSSKSSASSRHIYSSLRYFDLLNCVRGRLSCCPSLVTKVRITEFIPSLRCWRGKRVIIIHITTWNFLTHGHFRLIQHPSGNRYRHIVLTLKNTPLDKQINKLPMKYCLLQPHSYLTFIKTH